MRLIGLMSFWDEPPRDLRKAIESYHAIGMTHLVTVDGAYGSFPGATPVSDKRQHAEIADTCDRLRIDLRSYLPMETWPTETQKRGFMFHLAAEVFATTPDDWFVVVDADEHIDKPFDVRPHLQRTELAAADFQMIEPAGAGNPAKDEPLRKCFRALPGLTVRLNHFTYATEDRVLWGYGAERGLDLTALKFTHTTNLRKRDRRDRKKQYYDTRDKIGLERHASCYKCGQEATDIVGSDLHWSAPFKKDGVLVRAVKSTRYRCCERHAKRLRYENRHVLERIANEIPQYRGLKYYEIPGVEPGYWCNTPKGPEHAMTAVLDVPKVLAHG